MRKGIALFLALGVMTVLGLLVAGAAAVTMLAQRSSRLVKTDASLDAADDYALSSVLADPAAYRLSDLPLGVASTFSVDVRGDGRVTATVAATRLPKGVVWLVAQGSDAVDFGQRRFNVVARFPSPGSLPGAGLVAHGSIAARDAAFDVDTARDADCASTTPPSVIVGSGATADLPSGVRADVSADAADPATYYLTARQITLLDGGFGVVHVRGDTTIAGGSFDGVLVVEGALTITGAYQVTGLVVARGPIVATAANLTVVGSAMSLAAPPAVAIQLGGATIRYAPCTVARAFRRAVLPRPVRLRSWAELF
jgi:hypothetical protein